MRRARADLLMQRVHTGSRQGSELYGKRRGYSDRVLTRGWHSSCTGENLVGSGPRRRTHRSQTSTLGFGFGFCDDHNKYGCDHDAEADSPPSGFSHLDHRGRAGSANGAESTRSMSTKTDHPTSISSIPRQWPVQPIFSTYDLCIVDHPKVSLRPPGPSVQSSLFARSVSGSSLISLRRNKFRALVLPTGHGSIPLGLLFRAV